MSGCRDERVADWLPPLAESGIPAGPINSIEQMFADPQVQHRKLKVQLPRDGIGNVPGVACPIRLSDSPVRYERAPPALGDSTREVLRDRLHMSDEAIQELQRPPASSPDARGAGISPRQPAFTPPGSPPSSVRLIT